MEAYSSFAAVYDLFMDNVPYEEWSRYLITVFEKYGITDGLLLDLGCGTGKLTQLMSEGGYDMIGVDNSYEMLDIAKAQTDDKILYLMQDMRAFELYGTVAGIYSACDSVNYIMEEEELKEVFSLVNNYLDPGGIFIFDFNSSYKYHELLAENTFAETREEGSFIWENYFDEEEGINEYDLTLYIEAEDGRFERYQELHYQRCYEMRCMCELLEAAGLKVLEIHDDYTMEDVREDSERILIVAQEQGK